METNRIYNGDAFNLVKEIKVGSVDLVLTSPPYGIGKAYETRSSYVEDYIESMKPIIAPLVATIRPGGYLVWQVGTRIEGDNIYPLSEFYLPLFREAGLKLVNELIWEFQDNKPFAGSHYRRLTQSHETALIFRKDGESTFNLDAVRVPQKYPRKKGYRRKNRGVFACNPLGKNPGDVWDIHTLHFNSPERWDHPAQFPEELCRRLILLLTNPGDLVLDPFAGVATTLKVAKDLGRMFLGFEKEPHYYNQAVLRLNDVSPKGQLSLWTDFNQVKLLLAEEGEKGRV